jgi:hypothetical protein
LLREAEEEAAYVPSGEFVVRLPENYLLHEWGVAGLRVYARPDYLWVMALDEDGKPDTSFRWEPADMAELENKDPPPYRWLIAEEAAPLVDVTMAALWRDLRCAGSDAIPLPSSKPRRRARSRASHQVHRPQQAKSRTVRHLPRPRRIALGGERDWGDQIDRETIERRAHGVRGHLRRLPADWRVSAEARELARSFSLTLPDGYTFVRPHVRGGQGDEGVAVPGDEVIVVAQGLATVMSLL